MRVKKKVFGILNRKNLIGVLLFAVGGYIGGDMLMYSLRHYSYPGFSLQGAVLGVCIAVGYLILKGEEKTARAL